VLGGFISGEFISRGVLSLRFSLPFLFVCHFSYHLLILRGFLLLDDLLELFFCFWSSSCASCGLGFEIQMLCICVVNVLIKGEIEKPSGNWFDL
jgi:hypothetical protein